MKHHRLIALIILAVSIAGLATFLKFAPSGTNLAWKLSNEGKLLLPLIGISALLDSINPCAFSILLLTIAFIFGAGQLRSRILSIGGLYILGIFFAYLAIGLGILRALYIFNTPHFMGKLGSAILIAFGAINVVNEFFPAFPIKLRIPHPAHKKIAELMDKSSPLAAFALGGLVGICEFPCTGGPYLMILGMLHDQATYLKGFGYLIFYNFVFVLPLIAILLIASDKTIVEKVRNWQKTNSHMMRLYTGTAMIILGSIIYLIT